ncbi:redox-regulatory protein FAM213A-like isoform X1 [Lates japonicus]|uniref:Peroxiredoxin-like 2A n=1 Tax=Lates japonicus TaxID=270547 RepID=A0AAD3N2X4_LATJO|nr:redox-regulatory protein FAM213A-like isoform X1 [Lates japonicus]
MLRPHKQGFHCDWTDLSLEGLRSWLKTSDSFTLAARHGLVACGASFGVMVPVTTALKVFGLFVAELISSITDWFQTKPAWANIEVLENTELKTTGGVHERHKAKTLWEKTGAVEAAELSSLKSQLQDLEVPLLAVVKENLGKELDCFKKYFSGKVYVDQQKNFYGPQERWMFLSMFLRIGVWRNLWRAYRRGFRGNLRGEGLVLGGVFVIGPGDQGILLEHREKDTPARKSVYKTLERSGAACRFIDSVFSSGLEGELFGMGMWSLGLGAVGAALAGIFLANTDLCLPKAAKASLEYLEDADLRSTTDDDKVIKAKGLWEKNGAVVMAEAAELSSLKPQLEELGVPLVAVVKENVGTEIQDFRPHFAGDIYVDEKKHFYGPLQRKMGGLGFIRLGVWQNFMRAWRSGYQGNMNGEGFILGGVFVIGPGDQGILLEHREKEFGDKVDTADVLEAVKKIVPVK